jgi:hypothetical protein
MLWKGPGFGRIGDTSRVCTNGVDWPNNPVYNKTLKLARPMARIMVWLPFFAIVQRLASWQFGEASFS